MSLRSRLSEFFCYGPDAEWSEIAEGIKLAVARMIIGSIYGAAFFVLVIVLIVGAAVVFHL